MKNKLYNLLNRNICYDRNLFLGSLITSSILSAGSYALAYFFEGDLSNYAVAAGTTFGAIATALPIGRYREIRRDIRERSLESLLRVQND